MNSDRRLAAIEFKLNLLLIRLMPADDIREVELEAQYLEVFRQMEVNPAMLREFVQNNADWVAKRNQKSSNVFSQKT